MMRRPIGPAPRTPTALEETRLGELDGVDRDAERFEHRRVEPVEPFRQRDEL